MDCDANQTQERSAKSVGLFERKFAPEMPGTFNLFSRDCADAETLLDYVCTQLYWAHKAILDEVVARETNPFRAAGLLHALAIAESVTDQCGFATELNEPGRGTIFNPTRLQLLACCPSLAMKRVEFAAEPKANPLENPVTVSQK